MSKIRSAFENGKAFIPFITCGDPNLETTAKIVREAVANGADLIELGIPFSDPTAEGPVIQSANIKALEAGVTTDILMNRRCQVVDVTITRRAGITRRAMVLMLRMWWIKEELVERPS